MRDITHKIFTKRVALAESTVKMSKESIKAIKTNTTFPKKDVLAVAKAAGYLAVKNTPSVIPHCHPIPIENVTVDYEFTEETVKVLMEVETIYKTGCEVEAMHGASLVALTIYDMLKPMDKDIEILATKLLKKKGGKSDFFKTKKTDLKTAVIVMSDSIAAGKKEDKAGKEIIEKLKNFEIEVSDYSIISDDLEGIREKVKSLVADGYKLVLATGGTGLSPRDNTPEALKPLFTKEIDSVMEAARNYGQMRTPLAMLSRGVAGFIDQTMVIGMPGSTKGARETVDALFPHILHVFKVQKIAYKHEDIDNN